MRLQGWHAVHPGFRLELSPANLANYLSITAIYHERMLRILSHCSANDSDFAFLRTGATHSILSPLIERSRVIKNEKHKFSQADFRQMYKYVHIQYLKYWPLD